MSARKSKYVIGLMSGTSVDGVDASLVKINPDFTFEEIYSTVYNYPVEFQQRIKSLFNEAVSVKELCVMNFLVAEHFSNAVEQLLEEADLPSSDVDFIGSHGQTIYHYPTDETAAGIPLKSTLQIGDISVIAKNTEIDTIGNFRTADIAAGGNGAPLVCFADEKIFGQDKVSRAIQNLGGIANVTVVSPHCQTFAFDNGPANVLIDFFTNKYFNLPYDKNGEIAARGIIHEEVLTDLMTLPYFNIEPPKTTGRELFSYEFAQQIEQKYKLLPEDMIATMTAFTARAIGDGYKKFIFPKTQIKEIVLGGGGAYNLTLKKLISEEFDNEIAIKSHEDFGISNKFKEAIAFAMLAYAYYYDIANNVPSCTGASRKTLLGQYCKAL